MIPSSPERREGLSDDCRPRPRATDQVQGRFPNTQTCADPRSGLSGLEILVWTGNRQLSDDVLKRRRATNGVWQFMMEMHSRHNYMSVLHPSVEVLLRQAGVKLGAIDLNLLVVFDSVMQEKSVTRAGERLGLSQSAMSHALRRLRHMLKDDLFVRSPNGMVPTPRAEQLATPIRRALEGLQQSLEPVRFDPSQATTTFRISVDNYSAIVLVAPIVSRIAKIAPHATLDFRPSGTLNITDLLDRGELDLAIGRFAEPGERFSQRPLLRDRFVALLRKDTITAHALTLEGFAALPHLDISSSLDPTDFVDDALARKNLTRRNALRAPFLSVVRILTASDMVAVLPQRIAQDLARYRPLAIHALPHPSPAVESAMIWPRWLDNQPAHRWLRENVARAAAKLGSG